MDERAFLWFYRRIYHTTSYCILKSLVKTDSQFLIKGITDYFSPEELVDCGSVSGEIL